MGFCGSQQTTNSPAQEFDSLYSKSGAQPLRTAIFNKLPGQMQQADAAAQDAIAAARRGAAGYAPIEQYGQKVLGGAYLNSNPYLDRALASVRAASDLAGRNTVNTARADQAGQMAQTREQFARSGQAFGSGSQLAQEGTTAALNSQLARGEQQRVAGLASGEAGARQQNYQTERQYQQAAPSILGAALNAPVQLLSAIPGLVYSGGVGATDLIKQLASSTVSSPGAAYYKPGVGDQMAQGIGTAALASGAGF